MKILAHPSADSSLMLFSRICGCLLIFVGGVALAGWVFDLHTLRSSLEFLAPLNGSTAIALMLAGMSLLCANPDTPYPLINKIGVILSAGLVLLSMVTLLEYVLGVETGITKILSAGRSPEISSTNAGPMAPGVAISLVLSGAALFIKTGRFRKEILAQGLAVGSFCLSSVTLIGYLYGVSGLIQFGPYPSIPLLTASTLLVLALGILSSDPSSGIMHTLSSGALGGVMLRRVLPPAIVLTLVLGWLRLQGERAGLYGPEVGVALFALSNITLLSILLWRSASYINRVDGERKHAVLGIRDNQERYRLLFESIPLPMWVYDIKSLSFLEVNEAAVRHYGYTRQEFLSMTILDIRPEEEIGALRENLAHQPPGFEYSGSWKHRRKDGSIIEVEVSSNDFEFGASPARLVLATDITERGQAESYRRRMAAIVESSDDAIIGKTTGGIITSWNPGAEKIFGYTAEEMIGQPILRIFPPDRSAEEEQILATLVQGKTIDHFESVRTRKDGKLIDVSVTMSPLKDAAGTVIGISKIARDITERKRVEQSLLDSEKRYRTTLDNMIIGCQILSDDWHYLYVNDVAARQGQKTRQDLIGHTIMEVYPGVESTELFATLEKCLIDREVRNFENEFMFPDGTKGWFELSIQPVGEGLLILSKDVSNEVNLIRELENHRTHLEELVTHRTRQLELANKELESFSYSVSHDLRAPLRAIDGFSQALLDDCADKLDDASRKHLNRIRAASQFMGQLIDDILNLSRVSRSEIRNEKVDLSRMVESIASEFRKTERAGTVRFQIEPNVSATGDASLLRVVMENLIGNAWKYTSRHERATIEFGTTRNDGEHTFFVRDDGAGFNMVYANQLFGPFQRLHTASEFPGTGVGLATVQRIIHRHGGRVWAVGEVEKGATIYFTL